MMSKPLEKKDWGNNKQDKLLKTSDNVECKIYDRVLDQYVPDCSEMDLMENLRKEIESGKDALKEYSIEECTPDNNEKREFKVRY